MALELPGITERIQECWERVRRDRPGLSRAKFAEEKKLRQQSFNDWLNGVQPELDGLQRAAGAFGVPWQWLAVGDEGTEALIAYRRGRLKPPPAKSMQPERIAQRRWRGAAPSRSRGRGA